MFAFPWVEHPKYPVWRKRQQFCHLASDLFCRNISLQCLSGIAVAVSVQSACLWNDVNSFLVLQVVFRCQKQLIMLLSEIFCADLICVRNKTKILIPSSKIVAVLCLVFSVQSPQGWLVNAQTPRTSFCMEVVHNAFPFSIQQYWLVWRLMLWCASSHNWCHIVHFRELNVKKLKI